MRALLVLAAMGCDGGTPPPKVAPTSPSTGTLSNSAIAIPKDHPTRDILIDVECSVSPHPPSTYFYSSRTTYDLAARTWSNHHVEGNERENDVGPTDESAPKTKVTSGELTPDQIRDGHERLAKLLAGGPYEPVYPPSGGGRCTLELYVKGAKPFFSIDRADETIQDEVARLMKLR